MSRNELRDIHRNQSAPNGHLENEDSTYVQTYI